MEQGSKEWLEMRKRHIGASDAPILMRVNKKYPEQDKMTPLLLWKQKLGLIENTVNSFAAEYGKNREPYVRSLYEAYKGELFPPKIVFHPTLKYAMASLDGLSLDGERAIEIKCANKEDHEVAKQGKIPEHYYPQVQHQLMCLGIDEMDYVSFNDGDLLVVKVMRDDDYIDKLIEVEDAFWDNVMNLEEPEETPDDFIERSGEWVDYAKGIYELNIEIKRLQAIKEIHEDKLKELSEGNNSRGGGFTYKCIYKKGAVDYKKVPEIQNVDLDKFRKNQTVSWMLTKDKL